MAAPQQQGQGGGDNSLAALWILVAIFAAAAIIWYNFRGYLVHAFFDLKLAEIAVVSLFSNSLEHTRAFILASDPNTIDFDSLLENVAVPVGNWIRYPVVAILVLLAVAVYFGNTTRMFKTTYSMKTLSVLEKSNWPQITPVIKLDLANEDIDKGPWAMAMTPMQFCKQHKLLIEHKRQPQEGQLRKEASRIEATVNRGAANKAFALQLGPIWRGTAKLPKHAKALFAVFAARINGDGKAAAELLSKISVSAGTKLDFSGADELCAKYEKTKIVEQVMAGHGYVLTVMAAMIQAARLDGVLASADFLWLKPVDRKLWYMLNAVGRQTPWTEIAGPFAHWLAEQTIGKKLILPMVEEATNALELAIKDIIYHADTDS